MLSLRKKPINEKMADSKLVRSLTTKDLILLGLSGIIGTGIFTITGIGASEWAGPGLTLSFLIAAFVVLLSGLIFAEFSSRIPAIGGPYAYLYATMGEFAGWMAGWLMLVEFTLAGASVATGWSAYVRGFLSSVGINLPAALNGAAGTSPGAVVDIVALGVVLVVVFFVARDAQKLLRFNSAMLLLKVGAILLFLAVGVWYVNPSNWTPFLPFGFFGNGPGNGVVAGAALMFFAYLGFETISMAVEETKDPQKAVPRGILGSITIATILYIIVTLVLTGMVSYTALNVSDPVAHAMRLIQQPIIASIISVIAILTLLTVTIAMLYSVSRLVYGISKDGLLPKYLQEINPETKAPKNAAYTVGLIVAVFAGFVPLSILAEIVNMVTLAYLALMAVGLIVLRKSEKEAPKDIFKVPFFPVIPVLSVAVCIYLMMQLNVLTWEIFAVTLVVGALIYGLYGYRNSAFAKEEGLGEQSVGEEV